MTVSKNEVKPAPLRKIFNYKNSNSRLIYNSKQSFYDSIYACGCLFRKRDPNDEKEDQLLLIKYNEPAWSEQSAIRLDDLGGKVDIVDCSPLDTMAREVFEESNGLITRDKIFGADANHIRYFYNYKSKYYCAVVDVGEDFFPDTSVFGDSEIADDIKRTINWYKLKDIKHNMLCLRLAGIGKLRDYLFEERVKVNVGCSNNFSLLEVEDNREEE
jgi:hypothetical protein